jgi:hypothetical protein
MVSALSDDQHDTQEFSPAEFAKRLSLPPGATVTSICLVWFDVLSSTGNNTVRVHYRAGRAAPPPLAVVHELSLETRLQRLVARWRSQSRHPQRRNQPEARELLAKHADELLRELLGAQAPAAADPAEPGEEEGEQP